MKIRRIMVAVSILLSTIYVSIYGGTISYLLFFATVMVPAIGAAYMCYVYARFKIFQRVETRALIKGQEVSYYFNLSNESKAAFTSVAVSFIGDTQTVKRMEKYQEYCLLPGESVKRQTTLLAKYRGEYDVGIDSVTIKDFFGIFSLTYTCRSKIQAKVLPRIIKLDSLCFLTEEEDSKQERLQASFAREVPGTDARKYTYGDDRKKIHWKLSACKDELMVREYTCRPQVERILILDLERAEGDRLRRLRCEDKVIECAIAITNYMMLHGVMVRVIYRSDQLHEMDIRNQTEFDTFYRLCCDVEFIKEDVAAQVLREAQGMGREGTSTILITCHLTKELCGQSYDVIASGNEAAIVWVREKEEETGLPEGIPIIAVGPEDDLAAKLLRKGW